MAGRLTKLASIPRFATEIELPDVAITDPLVRSAKVSVPAGFSAAVMLMVPEFVPPNSPILTLLAESLFSSAATNESLPPVSLPKSISRASVRGAIVIAPEGAEMSTEVPKVMVSAFSKTSPELDVIDPVFVMDEP